MKQWGLGAVLWILSTVLWGQELVLVPDTASAAIGSELGVSVSGSGTRWRVGADSSWSLLDSTGTAVDSSTRLRLMALDSGLLTLWVYALSETGDTRATGSVHINVYLPPPRPEMELEDIHGPLDPGRNWMLLIGAVIAVLSIGAAILYFVRKKLLSSKPGEAALAEMDVDPFALARQRLGQMRRDRLWEQLSPEAFYTQATDVYRTYAKQALGVDALERTNTELAALLDLDAWSIPQRNVLRDLVQRADLAKYAEDRIRQNDPSDLDRIEQLLHWHEADRHTAHSSGDPTDEIRP